jgi:hypothetical protein
MSIILILSKMRQFFFPKTNECWDILYNKNNTALRTLMAYINFQVSCLCWHALFTESSVYYVLPSFHYLMLLLFALRRFTLIAVSFLFVSKSTLSTKCTNWLKKRTLTRAYHSVRASSFISSSHPFIYLFPSIYLSTFSAWSINW